MRRLVNRLRANARRRSRREIEAFIARVLTRDWMTLTPTEQRLARAFALLQGRALAEAAHRSRLAGSDLDDGACGDRADYVRCVVKPALYDALVLEPLDLELWRHAVPSDDVRLLLFRQGFDARKEQLGD